MIDFLNFPDGKYLYNIFVMGKDIATVLIISAVVLSGIIFDFSP